MAHYPRDWANGLPVHVWDCILLSEDADPCAAANLRLAAKGLRRVMWTPQGHDTARQRMATERRALVDRTAEQLQRDQVRCVVVCSRERVLPSQRLFVRLDSPTEGDSMPFVPLVGPGRWVRWQKCGLGLFHDPTYQQQWDELPWQPFEDAETFAQALQLALGIIHRHADEWFDDHQDTSADHNNNVRSMWTTVMSRDDVVRLMLPSVQRCHDQMQAALAAWRQAATAP